MRVLIVLACLTVAVAFVLGRQSTEDDVRAAIRDNDAALLRGDFTAYCDGLTERARSRQGVCAPPDGFQPTQGLIAIGSEAPRTSDIRFDADEAVVSYDDGSRRVLRKVDGRWLVD